MNAKRILEHLFVDLVLVLVFSSICTGVAEASKSERSGIEYMGKDLSPAPPPLNIPKDSVAAYLEFSEKTQKEYSDPARAAETAGKVSLACELYEKEVTAWQMYEDKNYASRELTWSLEQLMRLYFIDGRISDADKIPERMKELLNTRQIVPSDYRGGLYKLTQRCLEAKQFVVAERLLRELIPLLSRSSEGEFNSQLLLVSAICSQGRAQEAKKLGEQLATQAIKDRQAKRVTRARIALDSVYKIGRIYNSPDDLLMKLHLRKCPLCGTTTELLPISYGFRLRNPATVAASNETVHNGGCCVEPYRWYCKLCKQEF